MSCLSIRLPPPKIAWKIFTSKLQKLHRSKAIKKRKTKAQLQSINPFLRFDQRSRPPKNLLERTRLGVLFLHPRKSYLFKKKHKKKKKKHQQQDAVVYVDKLFKETSASTELAEEIGPSVVTKPKMLEQSSDNEVQRTNKTQAKNCEADEMWESMGLASPLMHGIDERAEEFIARIRAEMKFQERIALGL